MAQWKKLVAEEYRKLPQETIEHNFDGWDERRVALERKRLHESQASVIQQGIRNILLKSSKSELRKLWMNIARFSAGSSLSSSSVSE